jgi:hypothetical protein
MVFVSDEFELKFPELNRAELKRLKAELAELGHFNFRAKTELKICMSISIKLSKLFSVA